MNIKQESRLERGFLITTLSIRFAHTASSNLERYTVVQLSDLHSGITSAAHLIAASEVVQSLAPDLAVITGDFVQVNRFGGYADNCCGRPTLRAARRRRGRLKLALAQLDAIFQRIDPRDGIVGVFGNHDHKNGLANLRKQIGRRILWLNNDSIFVHVGAHWLQLGGTADFLRDIPNIEATWQQPSSFLRAGEVRALQEIPTPDFRILLSHNPDALVNYESELTSVPTLVLCGHTHGGQICFPGGRPLFTQSKYKKYVVGLSTFGTVAVNTSRGTGFGGVAYRLFCPPEIVVVKLESSPGP